MARPAPLAPEIQHRINEAIRDRVMRLTRQHESEIEKLRAAHDAEQGRLLTENMLLHQQVDLLTRGGKLDALVRFFKGRPRA
jgi:hypothetical protein